MSWACDDCLTRTWVLEALAGHLDTERHRILELLALPSCELIAAVGGSRRATIEAQSRTLDLRRLRAAAEDAGLEAICRCDDGFPARLRDLASPPSALFIAGGLRRLSELLRDQAVAVVGSRRASAYGLEVARSLSRGLSAAGLAVISGMARGIDAAAHHGAVEGGGGTIAVLPGPASQPYPPTHRRLYRSILDAGGVALSELGPGAQIRRWSFRARNRLIAGLADLTVVVEAGERSGSLATADSALELGRLLAAIPGRVTSPGAAGPNALLAGGQALLVRGAQDVLDHLFGAGSRTVEGRGRDALGPEQVALLAALADAPSTDAAVARVGADPGAALATLAELELGGWIRRGAGGRFTVIP